MSKSKREDQEPSKKGKKRQRENENKEAPKKERKKRQDKDVKERENKLKRLPVIFRKFHEYTRDLHQEFSIAFIPFARNENCVPFAYHSVEKSKFLNTIRNKKRSITIVDCEGEYIERVSNKIASEFDTALPPSHLIMGNLTWDFNVNASAWYGDPDSSVDVTITDDAFAKKERTDQRTYFATLLRKAAVQARHEKALFMFMLIPKEDNDYSIPFTYYSAGMSVFRFFEKVHVNRLIIKEDKHRSYTQAIGSREIEIVKKYLPRDDGIKGIVVKDVSKEEKYVTMIVPEGMELVQGEEMTISVLGSGSVLERVEKDDETDDE